jgi:5-methylcytosine-specific restriction endonuclease McrA
MTIGLRTLVLHPDYSPINLFPVYTVPVEEAIVRVLQGNAILGAEFDRKILTPSRDDLKWPSVIVNKKFYKKKSELVRLKRETLYYRDHARCLYCESDLTIHSTTCDHVVPKTHGGPTTWDNVVAACKRCNAQKGDKMPKGVWVPKRKPYTPTMYELIERRKEFPIIVDDYSWIDFIGPWKGDVELRRRVPA